MYLGTFHNVMIAPSLEEFIIYIGGGKQLETTLAVQGNKSCEVLKIKHHLPVYHLFLLALDETACLFSPPKFRSVTVPHSQCHSRSENTHQSISWKSELPGTTAMQVKQTNIFLFCLCKRPCLFPPECKSQPPVRRQIQQASKSCHSTAPHGDALS